MERLSAWIYSLTGTGVNWKITLVLVVAFVIVAGLWVRAFFSSKRRELQGASAKRFEDYCRMYDAGQRDSDDAGFCKFVQERQKHEEFLRRYREK